MSHTRTIRYDVQWLMRRVHVGTSYPEVAVDIASRCRTNRVRCDDRAKAITDALIQHRRNRADFASVMRGGRFVDPPPRSKEANATTDN